jgi:hypothetical protein
MKFQAILEILADFDAEKITEVDLAGLFHLYEYLAMR